MEKVPWLSVIIPAYNLEDKIGECLTSVINQDFEEMELIVVDNGSQDHTSEVIREYQKRDHRIILERLEKNIAPSGARNHALKKARGIYVHFCDGDDLAAEHAYRILYETTVKNDADVVTGNYMRRYPNQNNAIRPYTHYTGRTGLERCFEANNLALWNKIYKKKFLDENGLVFDSSMRYQEDILFHCQMLQCSPNIDYTDENVYIYTEPVGVEDTDPEVVGARYACSKCVKDGMKLQQKVFGQPLTENLMLWQRMFCHMFAWNFECSWKKIVDAKESEEAFYEMQKTLICIAQNNKNVLDWSENWMANEFIRITTVRFPVFCLMNYEQFMFIYTTQTKACHIELFKTGRLKGGTFYSVMLEKLEALKKNYSSLPYDKFAQEKYWHEWNDIFHMYWCYIEDDGLKEKGWNQMMDTRRIMKKTAVGATATEYSYYAVRWVFGVDDVALSVLSYQEYVMLFQLPENGYHIDIIQEFLREVDAGHVSVRRIIRAFGLWARYKLTHRRHNKN